MKKGPEKRRFPRVEVQMKVDIKTTFVYTTASVLNISERGVYIRTLNPLPIGSEIEMNLYFPGLEEPLKFVGVIRWINQSGEDPEIPPGMGVELIEAPEEGIKLLKEQMAVTPKNF